MLNINPKKHYGQNFLVDREVLDKIIEAMPNNNNHLVEIGPGLGDLTNKLVNYKDLTAYEVDADLISILKSKFAIQINNGKLKLFHTDVLVAWKSLINLNQDKYDLISNLPYYIATNIILRAFEDKMCEHIVVMVQKEVANKFTAKKGEKEYSSLAVITELISKDSKILFDVSSEAFNPPPKVTSCVLYIKKNLSKNIDKEFNKFLKVCFSQPRKKLIKNLSTVLEKKLIFDIFNDLNLNLNIRPHEVSSTLYSQIYTRVNYGRNKE